MALAGGAAAQDVAAPLSDEAPLRMRAERCGGAVLVALSQGPSPVLARALRALTFAAMAEGARSEDAQAGMVAWAGAYAGARDAPAVLRRDRPDCLRLAERLAR
jgi:hypothetical protein